MNAKRWMKSSVFALVAAGAALNAGSAQAQTQFDGCTDLQWNAFTEAVDANDPLALSAFVDTVGANCALERTATVLLCELDPAACLQVIEPAAGTPEEDVPQDEKPYEPPTLNQPLGEHIGTENDHDEGGNDGGSYGGDGGSPSSNNDDRGGYDKPTNEPTGPSISTL